jgi:hypothetical protein
MNEEIFVYLVLGIFVVLSIVLIWGLSIASYFKWSEANRRADELLRSVLTSEQYDQLTWNGYLDIPSPRDPGCIYRVPRTQGLVKVLEQGILKTSLCLQPLEMVPDADHVVMYKLMIEANEEVYLETANKFKPIRSEGWDD